MCQHISPKTSIDILGKQAEQTGEASALREDQICSAWRSEQEKEENNEEIKDEDLLCVGASRAEERGKQPTD